MSRYKAKFEKVENPILITLPEFQAYLSVGRKAALKVAEQSESIVRIGGQVRVNRAKAEEFLKNVSEL